MVSQLGCLDEDLLWQGCMQGPALQRDRTFGLCVHHVIMNMDIYRDLFNELADVIIVDDRSKIIT